MQGQQPVNAHTRIPHKTLEALILHQFNKRQRRIIDLIIRLSWGCGKDEAYIPKQREIAPILGITDGHISVELKLLKKSKIIKIRDGQFYSIQPQAEWELNNVRPYNPDKLTKLVSLNLKNTYQNGKLPQTETTETSEYTFDFSSISPDDLLEIDDDSNRKAAFVAQAYLHYWGKMVSSEADQERLLSYCDEYSSEWIKDAFEVSGSADVKKFSYLEAIFKSWRDKGREAAGSIPDIDMEPRMW